jgi:hypothetical protein
VRAGSSRRPGRPFNRRGADRAEARRLQMAVDANVLNRISPVLEK